MNPTNPSETSMPSGGSSAQGGSSSPSNGGSSSQKIKDTARETVDRLKSAASETASRVKEEAAEMADQRKGGVADRIRNIGSAVHQSADTLQEEDPNIAWLAHRAADRLSGAADYLREHNFGQLREDAEDIARRHPVAFFGGLFAAGLVIGNLLKASAAAATGSSDDTTAAEPYPRSEHVPSADQPDQDPWPAEPRAEAM